jgi:hypothetical protein
MLNSIPVLFVLFTILNTKRRRGSHTLFCCGSMRVVRMNSAGVCAAQKARWDAGSETMVVVGERAHTREQENEQTFTWRFTIPGVPDVAIFEPSPCGPGPISAQESGLDLNLGVGPDPDQCMELPLPGEAAYFLFYGPLIMAAFDDSSPPTPFTSLTVGELKQNWSSWARESGAKAGRVSNPNPNPSQSQSQIQSQKRKCVAPSYPARFKLAVTPNHRVVVAPVNAKQVARTRARGPTVARKRGTRASRSYSRHVAENEKNDVRGENGEEDEDEKDEIMDYEGRDADNDNGEEAGDYEEDAEENEEDDDEDEDEGEDEDEDEDEDEEDGDEEDGDEEDGDEEDDEDQDPMDVGYVHSGKRKPANKIK